MVHVVRTKYPVLYNYCRQWAPASSTLVSRGLIKSPVDVEAGEGEPYGRPMLRAIQLLCAPAVEEVDCDIMYSKDGTHLTFEKPTASKLYSF
jgi:hypothetical protein